MAAPLPANALLLVTVDAVAAIGTWVAVMPERPLLPIAAQPVALPLARIPVGAWPVVQRVGVLARAVAVAALPVVL